MENLPDYNLIPPDMVEVEYDDEGNEIERPTCHWCGLESPCRCDAGFAKADAARDEGAY